jgi:hypothetical protein
MGMAMSLEGAGRRGLNVSWVAWPQPLALFQFLDQGLRRGRVAHLRTGDEVGEHVAAFRPARRCSAMASSSAEVMPVGSSSLLDISRA